jgi:hypothetical protein
MTVKVVLVLLQRKAITQLQYLRGGREQRSSLVHKENRKHSHRNRAESRDYLIHLNSTIHNFILCC